MHEVVSLRRAPDDVSRILRRWILDGVLAPGTRLRVADLSARLGLSPMPVREAIARLEAAGLVATAPHRGAWVAGLDAVAIGELYDVRLILEPEAARRAAERMDRARAALLRTRLAELRASLGGEPARVLDCDEALLLAVFDGCGNAELVREIVRLWDRVRPHKLLHLASLGDTGDPARIGRWAAELVRACTAGDGERAAEWVREPLLVAKAELTAFAGGS